MPTDIKSLQPNKHHGARVKAIAAGEYHTLFLFDNGQVYGCGRTDGYELGLDDRHPAMVRAREVSQVKVALKARRKSDIKIEEADQEARSAYVPEPIKIPFPEEDGHEAVIEQIVCSKRQ
jgi:regulator of chromosome condensation